LYAGDVKWRVAHNPTTNTSPAAIVPIKLAASGVMLTPYDTAVATASATRLSTIVPAIADSPPPMYSGSSLIVFDTFIISSLVCLNWNYNRLVKRSPVAGSDAIEQHQIAANIAGHRTNGNGGNGIYAVRYTSAARVVNGHGRQTPG
jgi:hypothetical protein